MLRRALFSSGMDSVLNLAIQLATESVLRQPIPMPCRVSIQNLQTFSRPA